MGLLDRFSKKEKDIKEEKKELNNEESTILEESNYMLSSVKKDDVENNSYVALISDLSVINNEFNEYAKAFSNNKSNNKNELYQINNFTGASSIIDFFNDPKNKSKVKDLKKLGFNPATIMITIALCEVEKDVNEIKDISKSILNFLENEKQSEIKGDIKTLDRVIIDYKYNFDDEKFIENNYNQMLDIKRDAMHNIDLYQSQINDLIKKSGIIMTNKTISDNQNELEKCFSYYRLSLYVYCFASFMEIMLHENYKKDYLLSRKEELESLSLEYIEKYNKASEFVKKEANKSVEGNILSGIGHAGKAIGDIAEKVQIIKDKKIDTWFNKNGEELKNKGKDMIDEFSSKFEEMSNPNIKLFIDKIDMINAIYNDTKNIYFDKEKVYLEMVK